MIPNYLYRGDNIDNKLTMPGKYRSEGLFTKLINQGDPAYIDKMGLLESVRSHIKPESDKEKVFSSTSSFLSFSSNRERALYFAACGKPDELVECQEYYEKRYLFTINTSDCQFQILQPGVFNLEYSCNRKLISQNAPADVGICDLRNSPCEYCGNNLTNHHLLLIDVVTFLDSNPNLEKYEGAISNAQRDFEWLIMPMDYIPKLASYSARFPRSSIWHANHYILRSEGPRDPNLCAVLGQWVSDNELIF
jgi:hypothetical protein